VLVPLFVDGDLKVIIRYFAVSIYYIHIEKNYNFIIASFAMCMPLISFVPTFFSVAVDW
jgi:hypothetical protein